MENITRENCDKILFIKGMGCENCVKHVSEALNSIDKVDAFVSLENNEAYLNVFNKKVTDDMLIKAINDAGYELSEIVINKKYNSENYNKLIEVTDMMCKNCQKHVSDGLNNIDGVEADVALFENLVYVKTTLADDVLIKAIEDEDYTVGKITNIG